MDDMTTTPAGWHPDPGVPGALRYWDGTTWTEHRAPGAVQVRPRQVVSDQKRGGIGFTLSWILTVLTAGYMLPWAIAETRGKSNRLAIGLLTFLLGWTVIGWIVAMVMACTSHQKVAV